MKKIFLPLLFLIFSLSLGVHAQDALAPDGKPNEIYVAPFSVTITLDGETGDWAGVPVVTIPADAAPDATSVSFSAAADSEFLYLLGNVHDSAIVAGEHGTDYWNEDSVEFYINATGDLNLTSYQDGVAQLTFPAANLTSDEPIISGVNGDAVQAEFKMVETSTGYLVEAAIPLKNDVWAITPFHGGIIGFQVHLNSASTADRNTKLIWSTFDTGDQSYNNPAVFGYLAFFEVGSTAEPNFEAAISGTSAEEDDDAASDIPTDAAYLNPWLSTDERVEDLLARMTLEEKIGQMTLVEKGSIRTGDIAGMGIGGLLSGGGGSPNDNSPEGWLEMVQGYQDYAAQSRLGIPLIYGVDAVHGHNNVPGAVIFPHNIGLGAANNPELVEEICRVTAEEVIATGIYWNYSPVLAIPQDIRWGRTYEGYSEDPAIVSALGIACIRGLQGDELGGSATSILATPKHFIGDGTTVWGSSTTGDYQIDQGVMEADEAYIREVLLPPYQDAIDAGAQSIMISFSSWNETKMHAQSYLINDVLKGEMGFSGFIVSDWGGIDQINYNDYYDSVVQSVNAGVDMNMVPYDYRRFISVMLEAVENGDISEERIDDAVRRILTVKFNLNLFEWEMGQPQLLDQVGSEDHRALARQAVSESLVLLQNNDNSLPLDKNISTLMVAGSARDIGMQAGGWTISWQGSSGNITEGTTILQALEQTLGDDTEIFYDSLGRFRGANDADGNPLHAEVGIVVVGEQPYAEGVGDGSDLNLSSADMNLIERVGERVDTLVVILISGRPMIITDALDISDAFVAAWLPGTEALGITDVLFGDVPFTGKLPHTWPRSMDQIPSDDDPLFPLGYGLE